jgi:predicted amidohydrolase
VLIEILGDNIGSKMNALVDRGSPRDFLDIKHVTEAGLLSVGRCWELWLAKNPETSLQAAKQKVLLHLSALEARRPLDTISDPEARERAQRLRHWYNQVFITALCISNVTHHGFRRAA